MPSGVHPPRGARGECADEREPLVPTPAYALTAARFPVAFALGRFGFAGDNGSPNLNLNRSDTER